jgi:hypothetical protein
MLMVMVLNSGEVSVAGIRNQAIEALVSEAGGTGSSRIFMRSIFSWSFMIP